MGKTDLALTVPTGERMELYLDFCRETWGHVHDSYILHDPAGFEKWRHTLLTDYRKAELGIELPPGFVPSKTYWILKDCRRIIGIANFRPKLNEQLKNYGGHLGLVIRPGDRGKGYAGQLMPALIRKARELGIRELLITCEAANIASVRLCESLPRSRNEYDEGTVGGKRCRIHRTWLKTD